MYKFYFASQFCEIDLYLKVHFLTYTYISKSFKIIGKSYESVAYKIFLLCMYRVVAKDLLNHKVFVLMKFSTHDKLGFKLNIMN